MGSLTLKRIRKALVSLTSVPYYLLVCPVIRPRRTVDFLRTLYDFHEIPKLYEGSPLVPTIRITSLFPETFEQQVRLVGVPSAPGSPTCYESYLIASLVKLLRPKRLFEFGTFEGRTTLQLALNSPEDALIYTVDLPDNPLPTRYTRAYPDEASRRAGPVGHCYSCCPEASKIRQVLGDSATLDYSEVEGKIDFIFVDGDHSYDYVRRDSENAFKMLSPTGLILWHDYGVFWDAVARCLREVASAGRLYHVEGTTLVIFVNEQGENLGKPHSDGNGQCADGEVR